MTSLEKQLLRACWQAWFELNEIRARDGVPYTHYGTKSLVDEGYFNGVVDDCEKAIEAATGRPVEPCIPREIDQ